MKSIYIFIPSLANEAPIKNAICLSRYLSNEYKTNLIILKKTKKKQVAKNLLDNLDIIDLSDKIFLMKIISFKKFLRIKNKKRIFISYCFYADLFTYFFRKREFLISYVRGDYYNNYKINFGLFGYILYFLHILIYKNFNLLFLMHEQMENEYRNRGFNNVSVIGNFIDENKINNNSFVRKKNEKIKFIIVSRLVKLKQISELIKAFSTLKKRHEFSLKIYGDGPEKINILNLIHSYGLNNNIQIHKFNENIYNEIKRSDFLINPSLSEGISQSVIESLYLGVPVIHRNIKGANEIVLNHKNGFLFDDLNHLKIIILKLINKEIYIQKSDFNFLPKLFRLNYCIDKLKKNIEKIFNERL